MITVVTSSRSIVKAIELAASGQPVGEVTQISPKWTDRPMRVDFVITRARLSPNLERWAAGLGALIVQIPESVDYMIAQACSRDVTVMGSDYQTVTNRNG